MTRLAEVARAAGLGVVLLVLSGADDVSAQITVPTIWSRRASLPAFGRIERDCVGSLEQTLVVKLAGSRLRATLADGPARRRDPLPYPMDLSGALGDLSDTSGWPEPPPPPPSNGPVRPRPNLDPAIERAYWVHFQREWHIAYARDHAYRRVLAVPDGWLVAFNGGEYGGSLWWYPKVAGPGRLLRYGAVTWLERLGEGYVAIGGVAHMGMASGVVLWLGRDESGWSIQRTAELQYTPSAVVTAPDGTLAVATMRSVERVTAAGLDVVARTDFPDAPSSIVAAPGGEFALGMRVFAYVLRPGLNGYRPEIYVPPGCGPRRVGWICACAGTR